MSSSVEIIIPNINIIIYIYGKIKNVPNQQTAVISTADFYIQLGGTTLKLQIGMGIVRRGLILDRRPPKKTHDTCKTTMISTILDQLSISLRVPGELHNQL